MVLVGDLNGHIWEEDIERQPNKATCRNDALWRFVSAHKLMDTAVATGDFNIDKHYTHTQPDGGVARLDYQLVSDNSCVLSHQVVNVRRVRTAHRGQCQV